MATRGINEMYVYGGALANTVSPPTTTFVARVEPGSLKELWRTDLFPQTSLTYGLVVVLLCQ